MQKKMIGILAGVAAAHAVLLTGLMAGGGCTHPEILAPHTYNEGPEISGTVPGAIEQPGEAVVKPGDAPAVEGTEPKVEPIEPKIDPVALDNPPVKEPVAKGTTYTVKAGDTLNAIAYRHGVRPHDLAACNNLTGKAANALKVGQKLTIPAGGTYVAPKSTKAVKAAVKSNKPIKNVTTPKTVAERPADGVYVVKKGDTLDRIARRFGTTGRAIAKENNMDIKKTLHIGDKIKLPAGVGSVSGTPAAATPAVAAPKVEAPEPAKLDGNIGDDLNPEMTVAPSAPVTAPVTEPAPAAAPATAPTVNTEALEVTHDMTIEEFSKIAGASVEELRKLNPGLPADGKLKGGSYLMVPQL